MFVGMVPLCCVVVTTEFVCILPFICFLIFYWLFFFSILSFFFSLLSLFSPFTLPSNRPCVSARGRAMICNAHCRLPAQVFCGLPTRC